MSEPYFVPDQDWLSECCGALSQDELCRWIRIAPGGEGIDLAAGQCSKCHERTMFFRKTDSKRAHEPKAK